MGQNILEQNLAYASVKGESSSHLQFDDDLTYRLPVIRAPLMYQYIPN